MYNFFLLNEKFNIIKYLLKFQKRKNIPFLNKYKNN